MTLNDLERRNGPYFALISPNSVASGPHYVVNVVDVVVKSSRSLSHLLMSFLLRYATEQTYTLLSQYFAPMGAKRKLHVNTVDR